MAKFPHQPVFEKTDIFYAPSEDDPLGREMVVIAPCVCGSSEPGHQWTVAIPANQWRMTLRIGET